MDTLNAGDGVVNVHAGNQRGNALGVAGATAREGNLYNGVAIHLKINTTGANAGGGVGKAVPSGNPFPYMWYFLT